MNAQANTNKLNVGISGLIGGINAQIMDALKAHIDTHHTNGEAWPDDAEYAVVYRTSTWPCGWSDLTHVSFFDSRDGLDKWMEAQRGWAKCEDNHIAWMVYQWDLGPNHRSEFDHNAYRV